MSARRVITMSVLFRHAYLQSNRTPPPVNLWVGGWFSAHVGLGLKTAVKRDAVYAARLAARYLFFPTYESVCV